MTACLSFKPIARKDARILVLGSLPGAESLRRGQYYAKKENSFWRIMGALFGAAPELPYAKRIACLKRHHIAVWDVCATAERVGSLDSAITLSTVTVNDFAAFFKTHRHIKLICFNGRMAEKLFLKLTSPLSPAIHGIPHHLLPSTSPAHAGMRFEAKLALWRAALASRQDF